MKSNDKRSIRSLTHSEKDIIANGGQVEGVSEKAAAKYKKKMEKRAAKLLKATHVKERNDFSPYL